MEKKDIKFEDFLKDVNPAYHEFVAGLQDYLLENGCGVKMDIAKSGYLVSYSDRNKRVIMNFVFRKVGLVTRIYGDAVNRYNDFVETLPEGMVKAIEKAPECKRMADFTKCNPKCRMGYDFTLRGVRRQKCQYNSFMFPVNGENNPFIRTFLEKELNARMAR
jgi:hypothetical protein